MQYSSPALHLVLLVCGRSFLACSVSDAAGIDSSPSKSLINNGASGSTHELTARDHAGNRQSAANEQRKRRSTEVVAALASSGLDDTVDGRLKPKWTRNFMRFGRHSSAASVGSHETATGVTCFPISSLRRLQQQLADFSQPSATESMHLAGSSSLLPSPMTSSDIENHKRFMRFGKRFMRFGRLAWPSDLNSQHAAAQNGNGRVSDDAVYDGLEDYLDDGADSSKRFMRFGKRFMRFGRSSSASADDQDELVADDERRSASSIDVVCFYSGKDGVSISANKRFMRFGRKFDDSSENTEAGRPGSNGATLTPGDRDIEAAESAAA